MIWDGPTTSFVEFAMFYKRNGRFSYDAGRLPISLNSIGFNSGMGGFQWVEKEGIPALDFAKFDRFYKRNVRYHVPRRVDSETLNSLGFISEMATFREVPSAVK